MNKIISEIKPRDTNDYFAQVKVMKSDEDKETSRNLPGDGNPAEDLSMTMTGNKVKYPSQRLFINLSELV